MTNVKYSIENENRLLATHISNNEDFTSACEAGNSALIMEIIETEMKKNKLFTKGSEKLKADIIRMLQGREKVSPAVGQNILMFVWNSRAKGVGLGV
jgi:hypothetical protein